jgi:hypothetical protein
VRYDLTGPYFLFVDTLKPRNNLESTTQYTGGIRTTDGGAGRPNGRAREALPGPAVGRTV